MLKILPLGGLGEIGMNAMVIAYENDAILVDCGVLFPDVEQHGVDLVVPDFSLLRSFGFNFHAYVLTHGHEDHIGALPYALPMIDAPIWASRFTAGLVQHKLGEWGLDYTLELARPREKVQFGQLEVEFLRVTHSIPDGLALAIRTPMGVVIHTGDFKIDHRPVGGETTDLARFAEYGDQGVLALLSDSTNSDREGVSTSESDIGAELEAIMGEAEGRIFIASFASHVHRMQQIVDISRKIGRKVVLNGRSMLNNSRIGRDLGVLRAEEDIFLSLDDAKDADPRTLTILTTGSQAEPGSAMYRLANGDHNTMRVTDGDLVIFSSRSIPGNERAISRVVNGLVRQGARVLSSSIAKVHTSGHAHKEEQRLMINLVKPTYFVPIHGELHHLAAHAATAQSCGLAKEDVFVVEDGQTIEFFETEDGVEARLGERHLARKIYVDGTSVGDVNESVIKDRAALAEAGVCVCVVVVDPISGDVQKGPELYTRGIFGNEEKPEMFEEAKHWVRKGIDEQLPDARKDRTILEDAIKASLRRFFRKSLERKPVVVPFVLNV